MEPIDLVPKLSGEPEEHEHPHAAQLEVPSNLLYLLETDQLSDEAMQTFRDLLDKKKVSKERKLRLLEKLREAEAINKAA